MTSPTDTHWLDEERLRVYPRIFLTMFVLAAILYASTMREGADFRGTAAGADLTAFWSASVLVLSGRPLDVYDPVTYMAAQQASFPTTTSTYLWFYPPTNLLTVAPLALLPYVAAWAAWTLMGLAVFTFAIRPLVFDRRGWWVMAAFPGLWLTIAQGQNSFFTAALAGSALVLLNSHPLLAGVLIGALAFKPQLAILFPLLLLIGRHGRAFAGAAMTAVGFSAVSIATFGWQSVPLWLESLRLATLVQEYGGLKLEKIPSVWGALLLSGVSGPIAMTVHLVAASFAVVAACQVWWWSSDMRLRGPALIAGTFLALTYAFDYDLVWLAFVVAWLAHLGVEEGWRRGEREVLVAAWLLPMLMSLVGLAHIQLGPFVLAAVLFMTWSRARSRRSTAAR